MGEVSKQKEHDMKLLLELLGDFVGVLCLFFLLFAALTATGL